MVRVQRKSFCKRCKRPTICEIVCLSQALESHPRLPGALSYTHTRLDALTRELSVILVATRVQLRPAPLA